MNVNSDLFQTLILLIFVVYLCFTIFVLSLRYRWKRYALERKRYTYEFCLNDKNNYLENIFKGNMLQFSNNIDNQEEILKIFEHFNIIASGISNRILDEDVIKAFYEGYFTQIFLDYRLFLLKYREKNRNPYLFLEYEKLMEKWDSSNSLNMRRFK